MIAQIVFNPLSVIVCRSSGAEVIIDHICRNVAGKYDRLTDAIESNLLVNKLNRIGDNIGSICIIC